MTNNNKKDNNNNINIIQLVDTMEEARLACTELRRCKVVAFDMEGDQLGRHGKTSLLQLAISKEKVFVFDVLALGPSLFMDENLLSSILRDPSIIKLCYDCRCDSEALFYLHGVLPQGLYDLQIAYTLLYQQGTDPFLKGLHKALQAPGVRCSAMIIAQKLATKQQSNFGRLMMERPIPPPLLAYCASDVTHLFTMYELWSPQLISVDTMTRQRMLQYVNRQGRWCMSRLDFACRQTKLWA